MARTHAMGLLVALALLPATLFLPCPQAIAAESVIRVFDLASASPTGAATRQQRVEAWELAHAVATLQGIVNRKSPRLFVRFLAPPQTGERVGQADDFWLGVLRRKGAWLERREFIPVASLEELVRAFQADIKGAVVYDPNVAATSNVASTIAGVEDLVAVRYDTRKGSVYERLVLQGPRLPVRAWLVERDGRSLFTGQGRIPGVERDSTGSAKCDAYLWAKAKYLDNGKTDGRYIGYYPDQFWIEAKHGEPVVNHLLTNHDFFVLRRAFFCDLHVWPDEAPRDDPKQAAGTDRATFQEVLLAAYKHGGAEGMIHIGGFTPWTHKYTKHTGGKHDDVPTEWETARLVSAYNAFLDADAPGIGALANASFYAHYPLKARYPQRPQTTADVLRKRGFLDEAGNVVLRDRQYCMVYLGDFDSAAWAYQVLPSVWNDAKRGQVPLNWAVSPALERRIPMVLAYLRETATANDWFIAADNGAGYINPGMLQAPRELSGLPDGIDAWARHCEAMYKRWDITITGFVIDGYAPGLNSRGVQAYARFSPDGVVAQKIPPGFLWGNTPFLRADHDLSDATVELCVRHATDRIRTRELPFHWFRTILRGPDFQLALVKGVRDAEPRAVFLDAPTFFELLRRYLAANPELTSTAIKQIPNPETR